MSVDTYPTFMRVLGSLWFAAVLLVLLLVAMAGATVYETMHGSEQALAAFYTSWWFQGLLSLLGVNVLMAMVLRWPFTRRQVGFVVTHLSILAVLGGALVTKLVGLDGRLAITEGQSVDEITLAGRPSLTVLGEDGKQATADLNSSIFAGFSAADAPPAPPLALGKLRVEIVQYLPDSEETQRVVDDPEQGRPAIEVELGHAGHSGSEWIFAGGSGIVSSLPVAFRLVDRVEAVARLLSTAPADESASKGTLLLTHQGREFRFPIEQCQETPAALADTGYTVRVLRYLPHATIGAGREIVNATSQPLNPYVEVEIVGPHGPEQRRAFARFPEFDSMHGSTEEREVGLTFQAAETDVPESPIEIVGGPDGGLHVRFSQEGAIIRTSEIALGKPLETPWSPWQLTVRQRLERARRDRTTAAVTPVRQTGRVPAVRLRLVADEAPATPVELWVRDGQPRMAAVGEADYQVAFGDKLVPLGFEVVLDRFRLGTYPGSRRPRSFESRITINDPHAGGEVSRVISMNHPTEYGGFTFYQSSYDSRGEKAVSVLSVARDPGRPIVFTGYVGMLVGMVWVLVLRMRDRKTEVPHSGLQPEV